MPDMKRLLVGEVLCGEDPHYISEPLKEGALYEKPYLPGGGGYGDPLDREPTRVERDVGLGFVSPWAAASLYGLVGKQTETEGEWKADAAETAERRAQMRRGRLARGVPVKEWWRAERRRILQGRPKGEAAGMYEECFKLSPAWARAFRDFWALPDDAPIAAGEDAQGRP